MIGSHARRKQSAVDRAVDAFETLTKTFDRMPDAREVAAHLGVGVNTARLYLQDARHEGRIPVFVRTPDKAPTRVAVTKLERYLTFCLRPMVENTRKLLIVSRLPRNHPSHLHLRQVERDLRAELRRKSKLLAVLQKQKRRPGLPFCAF